MDIMTKTVEMDGAPCAESSFRFVSFRFVSFYSAHASVVLMGAWGGCQED